MTLSIFLFGFVINAYCGFPPFAPIAACGGCLWAVGNTLCIPIINRLGMGLGLVMWSGSSMITGWVVSVTGGMGIKPQRDSIDNWPLNVAGVIFALVSLVLAMKLDPPSDASPSAATAAAAGADASATAVLADPEAGGYVPLKTSELDPALFSSLNNPLIESGSSSSDDGTRHPRAAAGSTAAGSGSSTGASAAPEDPATVARRAQASRRYEGVLMAAAAGFCFGSNYNGVQYTMDNNPTMSQRAIDYAFSHFCGIFIAAALMYLGYCSYCVLYARRTPEIPQSGLLTPAAAFSGVLWGCAQTGWFVANDALSQSITWPLIVVGPSVIGCAWGVVLGEIQGRRNFLVLAAVLSSSALSAILVVASKK
jgi:hypothetical protein